MRLTTEPIPDGVRVTVREQRLDSAVALKFKERLREVMATGATRVVLDLAQVNFMDSSGLGAILAIRRDLAPGRCIELCALTPNVARVFHLTRMEQVFTIHPSAPSTEGDAA